MKNMMVFLMIYAISVGARASQFRMFSFKDKGKENYINVHYDGESMKFEECFRHQPCRFFGEIDMEKLDELLTELTDEHQGLVSDRMATLSMITMGVMLGLMAGAESMMYFDRDQLSMATKSFFSAMVFPGLCGLIPMVFHEKASLYNTALMLEGNLTCDRSLKLVRLEKVRADLNELIDVLN